MRPWHIAARFLRVRHPLFVCCWNPSPWGASVSKVWSSNEQERSITATSLVSKRLALILSLALRTALRVEVWELSFCLAAAARRVIDLATNPNVACFGVCLILHLKKCY